LIVSSKCAGCPAAVLLAHACFGFALHAQDPADLVEHVQKTRKEAMTEAKITRYNGLAARLNAATRHRMPVIRLNKGG
jgi:hypothetical protein